MKKIIIGLFAIAFIAFGFPGVHAATIDLFDWGFNIDGTTYCDWGPCDFDSAGPGVLPGSVNTGGFDFMTGLGTLSVAISGTGAHNIDLFVDHEIDESLNTFFNEFGTTSGSVSAGQSWEIDEPGYVFGDIFDNFGLSALDNSNGVPAGSDDDVSMAMGWDFALAAGETAMIDFLLSDTSGSGFNLIQTDPDSIASIFFSSALSIDGSGPQPIPEPGTILLLGSGLIGLAGYGRKRFKK